MHIIENNSNIRNNCLKKKTKKKILNYINL